MPYSLIDIFQGKPGQDREERQARIDAMKQGIQEKEFDISKRQREEDAGLTDKDIQRRGTELDIANTDAEFKKTIQAEQQGIMSAELHSATIDASMRQTANIWRAFVSGHKPLAIKSLNDTHLIGPGEEYSDMTLDDSDQKGQDGKPIKMLTLIPKGEGKKPIQIPVPVLEKIEQQYGAQYKVVGGALVRIGSNGQVTPLFQPDEFKLNTETGVPFSSRTGQSPASGGVRPPVPVPQRGPVAITGGGGLPAPGTVQLQPGATPAPAAPPPAAMGVAPADAQTPDQITMPPQLTRKQETHVDTRVTQGTAVVNKYFGISEFSGLDPKNQPKYIGIVNRMGQLVRGGANPEAAANTAIAEAARAERLQGGGVGGTPGAYNGPTPWRQ